MEIESMDVGISSDVFDVTEIEVVFLFKILLKFSYSAGLYFPF